MPMPFMKHFVRLFIVLSYLAAYLRRCSLSDHEQPKSNLYAKQLKLFIRLLDHGIFKACRICI